MYLTKPSLWRKRPLVTFVPKRPLQLVVKNQIKQFIEKRSGRPKMDRTSRPLRLVWDYDKQIVVSLSRQFFS
jgi:hypothetical protein